MKKLSNNQSGFSAVETVLLAVIIIALAGLGWYLWNYNKSNKTNNSTAQSNASNNKTLPMDTYGYYECWDKVGTVSLKSPYDCVYQGKTYSPPKSFSKTQIKNFEKVPASAQNMLVAVAKKNFDECSKSSAFPVAGQPKVELAQSNFVAMGIFCDSGHIEFFGQDNGTWKDLGGTQLGIGCDSVDKYKVTQSAVVNKESLESYSTCISTDGTSKQIPKS